MKYLPNRLKFYNSSLCKKVLKLPYKCQKTEFPKTTFQVSVRLRRKKDKKTSSPRKRDRKTSKYSKTHQPTNQERKERRKRKNIMESPRKVRSLRKIKSLYEKKKNY